MRVTFIDIYTPYIDDKLPTSETHEESIYSELDKR